MDRPEPLLSVIVPIFNTGTPLKSCLDSILGQTLTDLDIILVDDGSSDPLTLELIDAYVTRDSRIRLIRKENGGQSSARNIGLDKAIGVFVAWVDHDDVLNAHMYKTLYAALVDRGGHVAECRFQPVSFDALDRLELQALPRMSPRTVTIEQSKDFLVGHIHIWNRIYRTEWLRENNLRFADLLWEEDVLFSFKTLITAETLQFIDDALYFHLEHGENTTHRLGRKIFDAFKAQDLMVDFLRTTDRFDEFETQLRARMVKDILFGFNAVHDLLEQDFFSESCRRLQTVSLKSYSRYYSTSKKKLLGYAQKEDYEGFKRYQAFREWRKLVMRKLFKITWKFHEKSVTLLGIKLGVTKPWR
jgi:glycosyltransferase involved in cell wall biosynthesis